MVTGLNRLIWVPVVTDNQSETKILVNKKIFLVFYIKLFRNRPWHVHRCIWVNGVIILSCHLPTII